MAAHPADLDRFVSAYRGAVAELLPLLGEDRLATVGRHNPGWGAGRFDVGTYLRVSEKRYATALLTFWRCGGAGLDGLRVLDVGGFMGAFPLALHRCGADVSLTEKYGYYYGAFDPIRDLLADAGVTVHDRDFTEAGAADGIGPFDLVTNMALVEHLANSPRPLMDNTRAVLRAGEGRLVLEAPNLAYGPKRLSLLRGSTIHPPLADVYVAETPFTGHHREYTMGDMRQLLELGGFDLQELVSFDYTPHDPPPTGPAAVLASVRRRIASLREVLLACATPGPSRGA